MNKFIRTFALIGLSIITFSACAQEQEPQVSPSAPNTITIKSIGLTPEGITVNPENNNFIVSSVGTGNLVEVDMQGNHSIFADSPKLISTLGTHVDPTGRYVVTAICDIGFSQRSVKEKFGQVSSIAIFDLATRELMEIVDFTDLITAGTKLANDFTWDNEGNIYVTDSYAGAIYKVDKDYEATVFLSQPEFVLTNPYSFGLNGIVFDEKENILIVSKLDEGKMYKVPVDAPQNYSAIQLKSPIPIDGMLLKDNGDLLVASSVNTPQDNTTTAKVYKLNTDDNWQSLNVMGEFDTGKPSATTLTERNGEVFTVHAHYFGNQPVQEFHIQKVKF